MITKAWTKVEEKHGLYLSWALFYWRPGWLVEAVPSGSLASPKSSQFLVSHRLSLPTPTTLQLIMATRSALRALHYSAKRRVFQPSTPYRCFSCARRAQEQTKSDQERMTHFGFTNVPESEKVSRGTSIPNTNVILGSPRLTRNHQWVPSSALSHPPTTQ